METNNARIESTMLGNEDHGMLTCFLFLDYGGTCQGFGGYGLDGYNKEREKRIGGAWGMEFIHRILEVLEVASWEKLPGTYLRAKHDWGKVYAIGHIIKDQWFEPEVDLAYLLEEPCAKP